MSSAAEERGVIRVFVGGLAPDVQVHELSAKLESFGRVREVELLFEKSDVDNNSRACRGFAFVNLEALESDVERCISTLNHCKWKGRQMTVAFAKPSFKERVLVENTDA
mmetsp:Transcript_2907/g.10542  ORF Transcript_2907/g.10542 Transcript_2907/m.10542 type:complete len:109 (-) Transcript_2907:912-1238(-)